VRRCLRSFLVAVLSLTLLGGPAHACWRTRARHCRPVVVVSTCQPVWDTYCNPCGETVVTVESICPPAAACCGEVVSAGEPVVSSADPVVTSEGDQVVGDEASPTPAVDSPTAVAGEHRGPSLETVTPPPLEPAGGGVEQASNEQPLPEPVPPANEPTDASVLERGAAGEPEMPATGETDVEAPAAPTAEPDLPEPSPGEPVTGEPVRSGDEPLAPEDGSDEPPMEEDAGDDSPTDPDEAPATPVEPAPAPEPEPEPEPENIFEELEEDDAPADGTDAAEMPAASENPFDEPADEPAPPAGDLFDSATVPSTPATPADPAATNDPFAGEDAAPADEAAPAEEMADAEVAPAADGEDSATPVEETPAEPAAADPFAPAESAPADEPAGDEATDAEDPVAEQPVVDEPTTEPVDEPAPADDFAAAEQPRRWIDATGTGSIVGTLVDVGSDDRCVLTVGGRRIVVPLEKLSEHDRDYVRRAGLRLAKLRGSRDAGETAATSAPATTDTAGL
jgi:hypothetical protein